MKATRIIVLIVFFFFSAASLAVFISDKISEDKTLPEIRIEGETIEVSLKMTDEELLKGVTAYDEKDKDLTDQVLVESVSRFIEKGVCRVTYAVCDSNNNVAKATRKVRIKDYKSPEFAVSGNLCFSMYESINVKEMITANDCIEGDISGQMIMTSDNISSSVAGAYTIDVSVTNKKGDTSTVQLPIIVEDRPISVPVITLEEYLVYTEKDKSIDFESYIVDAKDTSEESIREYVTIESNVDFSKEGTYHVHYYVTDSLNQRGHSVMTVVVGG